MPADLLPSSQRFSALDGLAWVYVPVIAASSGIPTRAEIDAGVDLSGEYQNHGGFSYSANLIETKDLTRWPKSIAGDYAVDDMFLELYADEDGDDARDVVPEGTTGGIVKMRNGDIAAKLMDCWPIRVTSCSEVTARDAANYLRVNFGLNGVPAIDKPIPAHAGP